MYAGATPGFNNLSKKMSKDSNNSDPFANPVLRKAAREATNEGAKKPDFHINGSYQKPSIPSQQFEYTTKGNQPVFPIDVFPENIQYIIERLNEVNGFEPQIVAGSILFVVSTIVGNRREVVVKSNWKETPNLWLAIVGKRGTAKTPTMNYCIEPLKDAESDYNRTYVQDLKTDEKAIRHQRYTSDTTVEGLIRIFKNNPNGVGMVKDELNGFFREMNQYKKSGGDLEFYLSAWSGGQKLINRATKETVTIDNLFLSMLGSVQPEVLQKLAANNTDNGMLDRWLYIETTDRVIGITEDDFPAKLTQEYKIFIEAISQRVTGFKQLTWGENAYTGLRLYDDLIVTMRQDDNLEDNMFTYLSKMETYLIRFSGLIAIMNGTDEISHKHVTNAYKLVQYFIETGKRTFIDFENQKTIEEIFKLEKAVSKKQKATALVKHLPKMNPTEMAKAAGCSRPVVYKAINT